MTKSDEIDLLFPAIKNGTYLNTPASGLLSNEVITWKEKMHHHLLHHPYDYLLQMEQIIERTKDSIGNFFRVEKENIALCPNFSYGLNILLEALPQSGKMLLLEDDYPSIRWPVEERSFKTNTVKINHSLEENIETAFKDFCPNIFLFSIVQWLDGVKVDLHFIQKLKNKYPDVLFIADGTQYLGTEDFYFAESGIDIIISSGYKWLNAGFGNGFLMVQEKIKTQFHLHTIGFNSSPNFKDKPSPKNFVNYFSPGHLDVLSFGSIEKAIELLQSIGEQKCYHKIYNLATKAKEIFKEKGWIKQEIAERPSTSPIFNLQFGESVFHYLQEQEIYCSLRGGGIRVGFHHYNSENDLDRLVEAIKGILR